MKVEVAERLRKLPPYLFARIDELVEEERRKGKKIISLGVGDPDLPTPSYIVDELKKAVDDPARHHYPSYEGAKEFREAVVEWFQKRFQVELDPEREVLALIGSKEGIGHISFAFVDPGDLVLAPDPGYPVYKGGTILAGGEIFPMPLKKENGFLPVLEDIPPDVAKKAKIMFLNYPNNPTSATAEKEFFEKVVDFARKYGIVVCHDAAYSEITYDGYRAPSFLQVPGAKEVGVEFHSLSKTFNMTGWRIGFVVGNSEVISALGKVKNNLDSGVFEVIQWAGIKALKSGEVEKEILDIYIERRNLLVEGIRRIGLNVEYPKATFYLWVEIPEGFSSEEFALYILRESGVVVTPGRGFGEFGEGYIRLSFTLSTDKIKEVLSRWENLSLERK
ncbi:LL-diaminopimelate aminotransferase [Candidatus Calescamantes bacterium]|nr:LL-diaminopimelate aminotransferase [Candidatus Calescamantes bacterium]